MENEFIKDIVLSGATKSMRSADLDAAMSELIVHNYFSVLGNSGPYEIAFDILDERILLGIRGKKDEVKMQIPMRSLRKIVKDYLIIIESYDESKRFASYDKIEAIDMGRRAVHNEGAELLINMLEDKINLDFDTARQIFTIITILHMR